MGLFSNKPSKLVKTTGNMSVNKIMPDNSIKSIQAKPQKVQSMMNLKDDSKLAKINPMT
jgi:hypothetical protein